MLQAVIIYYIYLPQFFTSQNILNRIMYMEYMYLRKVGLHNYILQN